MSNFSFVRSCARELQIDFDISSSLMLLQSAWAFLFQHNLYASFDTRCFACRINTHLSKSKVFAVIVAIPAAAGVVVVVATAAFHDLRYSAAHSAAYILKNVFTSCSLAFFSSFSCLQSCDKIFREYCSVGLINWEHSETVSATTHTHL